MKLPRREFLRTTAAVPNAGPFVEFTIEPNANPAEPMYNPSLEVVDGKVKIPEGPGWGVEINPSWLEKAAYQKSAPRPKPRGKPA